ncbi:MAG TPA: RNA polymerase sigma factor [Thermoanaerobaculia bacterium]|nr:RNA polymerase sigma factor [Thermoanaerobaculia bacterium]
MRGALAIDFTRIVTEGPNIEDTARTARSDDRRLAAACAAGDPEVFEELYRLHGDRMKSMAWNHLGNIADAEDAVQETFIKIHRAAGGYSGEAAFSTWLFRILINTCYDQLRRRKRRAEESPIDDDLGAMRAATTVDETKRLALRKLLAALPEQRRSVFVLFEIEGLSHAEIATILDITEGNSKWILFSTKKQLQEQWRAAR